MRIFLLFFILSSMSFIVSAEKKSAEYFLQEGHIKNHAGNIAGAIDSYKKALEVDPNFEAAKLSLKDAMNQKILANFIHGLPKECQKTIDFEQTTTCAKKYFVIDGEPINPLIIKDLVPWISDSGEQVVAINLLDSQKSNKYFVNNFDFKKNELYFSISTTYESGSSFAYEVEGVTSNGIIVLKTTEWGTTGTGVFYNLLLVRIHKDLVLSNNLDEKLTLNRNRLVLENIGIYPLGDRIYSKINVIGNTINIETKQSEDSTPKNILIKLSL